MEDSKRLHELVNVDDLAMTHCKQQSHDLASTVGVSPCAGSPVDLDAHGDAAVLQLAESWASRRDVPTLRSENGSSSQW